MNRYRWSIVTPIKKIIICTPENTNGFTMGSEHCDIRVLLPEPVSVIGNTLSCGDSLYICSPDGLTQKAHIYPKRVLKIISADDESLEYLRISMEKITDSDDAWDRTLLLKDGTFSFGTREDCSVSYPAVGDTLSKDFSIIRNNGKLLLRADDVMFGVYVNQRRVKPGQLVDLNEGDFIFSSSASVYCSGEKLVTSAQTIVDGLDYIDLSEGNSHLVYPRMERTARTHVDVPQTPIEILNPPAVPEEQDRNIFGTIMPSLVMILLLIVIRSSGSMSGSSMILFSVASMSVGAMGSVASFIRDNKKLMRKKETREKSYRNYLSEMDETIAQKRAIEKEKLNNLYIDPEREIEQVKDFSASLFDRLRTDSDFLDVRLGLGKIRSKEPVVSKKQESFAATDELFYEPKRLIDKYEYSEGLPVVLPIKEANAVGFLGSLTAQCQMMQLVTLDLAVRQFADDVKLYYLVNDDMTMLMCALRLLPHIQDENDGGRNIALASEGYNKLLEKLCRLLAERENSKDKLEGFPWLIINIHADESVIKHPIMKYLPVASQLKTVFCFWASEREHIPLGCTYEIRLFTNGNRGMLRCLAKESKDEIFSYSPVSSSDIEAVSQRLAPIYAGEINLGAGLRSSCSFFDALGITEAKSDIINDNWKKANTACSLSVPIGVQSGDEPIYLDLHERADGPHGLVAGTTGSGKSEVILSYLLSLMYHYSPDDVNIVIIDFKGGGLGRQLQGIPHLTGLITNLEKHEIDRSLMSIKAELERRQRLLAAADQTNINDYTSKRKEEPTLPPMPHLILVVDEFAELKAQQPDFMNELISTARIGRSLGVHLILSTQKPSGVVNDQISSNMDFTMCLRVQTKADSNEMLQSPLAAEIRQPGRAYLKVSRKGLFSLFQSGYSGASADVVTAPDVNLFSISVTGRREKLYTGEAQVDSKGGLRQFDAVKSAILEAFSKSGKSMPLPLCLPSLPDRLPQAPIENGTGYCLPLGRVDDPANQSQYDYTEDLTTGNTLIVGGPQSGKTTLLQTIAFAAAERLTSADINIYVMDFNSGLFKTFERLDIIGGVVQLDDEEGLKNLLRMLRNEIAQRKNKLLEAEVISYGAYRETGRNDMPAILLFVDNFAVFKEVYDEKYGGEYQQILRDGPAVGINSVVTCAQTIALGYRRLCYFKERIAMFSSDKGEYLSTLECGRNITIPEIPGRFMFKHSNSVLMAQAYMYFADHQEPERGECVRSFINAHSDGSKARGIPGIPMLLSAQILEGICGTLPPFVFAYAMDFATVEPITMDLRRQFEFSLVAASDDITCSFVTALAKCGKKFPGGMKMHIVDGFSRALRTVDGVADYSLDAQEAPRLVMRVCSLADERLAKVKKDGLDSIENEPLEVVVLNSVDALNAFSASSEAWTAFSNAEERASSMRILFLFGDIANRQVSYSSPPLLKHIREARKAIVFENAAKIKFFELNLTEVRANSQVLGRDDGVTFGEQGLTRARVVR